MDLVLREISSFLKQEEEEIKLLEEERNQNLQDVLPLVYDFEETGKTRKWMRDILRNQFYQEESDEDEDISEEEYKHMLKMHKLKQKMKAKALFDPSTCRFKYYSADLITHERKWNNHYKTFKVKKKKSSNKASTTSKENVKQSKSEVQELDYFPELTIDIPSEITSNIKRENDAADGQSQPDKSLKKRKVDVDVLRKRIWRFIAKKEIPKAYRQKCQVKATSFLSSRKFCKEVMRRGRLNAVASQKICKETVSRSRRLTREMQMFWKRYCKVEKVHRKKAEKHAQEQRKLDESIREAKRQQRKLNFLISQTELFAHFLSKKFNNENNEIQNYDDRKNQILNALTDDFTESTKAIECLGGNGDENFARSEAEAIKEEALKTVEDALNLHRNMQSDFDLPIASTSTAEVSDLKSLSQPDMFRGELKSYQLKGMTWLVNLYQQGISGILADEMGLGKTVQTIAFLAHLAETVGIWGPFIVVAPASTLNNWHQEFGRFLPGFKVLPYWGNPNDRKILRKFWSQASTDKDSAPFHVLVTSYQYIISDIRSFQRVKWQFMVLDEAQALKSSSSNRWKTLLEFRCRNRLLLTGTPIQNTMAELWALLHFIMPSLFDSHAEFNEWFSKDIESHIENKSNIDEQQLSRLHLILKPFMLRRIKKDVENELSEKIEVRVHCSMTARQSRLYKSLQKNLKLEDLLQTAGSSSAPGNTTLMNLVMQFRKMCNHPDLFERREINSPSRLINLNLTVPKLLWHEGFLGKLNHTKKKLLYHDLSIHSPVNIFDLKQSLNSVLSFLDFDVISLSEYCSVMRNNFPGILSACQRKIKLLTNNVVNAQHGVDTSYQKVCLLNIRQYLSCISLSIASVESESSLCFTDMQSPVYEVTTFGVNHKPFYTVQKVPVFFQNLFLSKVISKPCEIYCNDRSASTSALESRMGLGKLFNDTVLCLYGLENYNDMTTKFTGYSNHSIRWKQLQKSKADTDFFHASCKSKSTGISSLDQNWSKICIPSKEYLVSDSGKMYALDVLLRRLKDDNHRVLIYSQMTKMIDLLEEYMLYRKHTYIRLDGSSRICDRRDMVADFQERNDIFVFLLSTRAGGLGINLTAADTVIFYDSDWNPTVDQQAMDRTHRLGQTKQVTVYRLVCQGTVDERILQRAEEKNIIQKMVISGGHFKQENLKTKEVVSLLLDDDQLLKKWNANKDEGKKQIYKGKKRGRKTNAEKGVAQAKRLKVLQQQQSSSSLELGEISAPTSTEPTPVPSPQSSNSMDISFVEDDHLIIVDDDEDLASKPPTRARGRGRGRPRIRPIISDMARDRKQARGGSTRARGTASGRRGRKPVRGRAAAMAGARAGAVAASAAAYAAYGYQYKDGLAEK